MLHSQQLYKRNLSLYLYKFQFGFLKGLPTTAQLLQVLHEIGQSLDNRTQTDAVFLDLAEAFDRVDHQLLLFKLQRFGITGKLLDWFTDYLSNLTSEPLPVLSGVPQGSILGPLLFLVFVNDLPGVVTTSSVALYAEDAKCYRTVNTSEDSARLQRDLDNICTWCKEWRMVLNQSKCTCLYFT